MDSRVISVVYEFSRQVLMFKVHLSIRIILPGYTEPDGGK